MLLLLNRCRYCRKRMPEYRRLGRCDDCHFDDILQMSMVEFGGSLTHFTMHLGHVLLDIASRREFQEYGTRGWSEIKKITEGLIHDELYRLLGIRVNEARAGGAGSRLVLVKLTRNEENIKNFNNDSDSFRHNSGAR